jgi:hypothetical protein
MSRVPGRIVINQTYLVTPIALHSNNQDVMIPHHATFDRKRQLLFLIYEQLPSSRIGRIVRESASACDSQKRAIM